MTTLMNERTSIGGGGGPPERGSGAIAEAVRIWRHVGGAHNPSTRDRLLKLWSEAEALCLTNIRASQNRRVGNPGPEGSIAKLMFAEVNQRTYELCVDLLLGERVLGLPGDVRVDKELPWSRVPW